MCKKVCTRCGKIFKDIDAIIPLSIGYNSWGFWYNCPCYGTGFIPKKDLSSSELEKLALLEKEGYNFNRRF